MQVILRRILNRVAVFANPYRIFGSIFRLQSILQLPFESMHHNIFSCKINIVSRITLTLESRKNNFLLFIGVWTKVTNIAIHNSCVLDARSNFRSHSSALNNNRKQVRAAFHTAQFSQVLCLFHWIISKLTRPHCHEED